MCAFTCFSDVRYLGKKKCLNSTSTVTHIILKSGLSSITDITWKVEQKKWWSGFYPHQLTFRWFESRDY